MGSVAWGIIGSLAGVLLGAWLASRWQRRQWIWDNKKAEYREILCLLIDFRCKLSDHASLYEHKPSSDDKLASLKSLSESRKLLMDAFFGSIFVGGPLLSSGIVEDFQNFYRNWRGSEPLDRESSIKFLAELQARLLRLTWHDLGLPGGRAPVRNASETKSSPP